MAKLRPLLAAKADPEKIQFPVIASPKIDGIRCLINERGLAISRRLKAIPNDHIQNTLNKFPTQLIAHHDGELVTYTDGKIDDFNTIQSKVMSAAGTPDFRYYIFDHFAEPQRPYNERILTLWKTVPKLDKIQADTVISVPTVIVESTKELAKLERQFLAENWEGVMIRRVDGPYKFGRSTEREGILLKFKRFEDDEAVVIGTVERFHNSNEATLNELGYTERSSHKANMVPTGMLGALQCSWKNIEFEIGTGFTEAQRIDLWQKRDRLIGETVTFKHQGIGSHGKPRFPVFLGFRKD